MPNVLPGTLKLRSADGAALEIAAGTPLPAERTVKHRTAFDLSAWSLSAEYRTASGAPHERTLPLLRWDKSAPAGRDLAISAWVSPHRAAFVEIGVDGKELYRFDPIALRDAAGNVAVSPAPNGATVVERGFASGSQPPPANVRIVTSCETCSKSFSMRILHSGHVASDFFYCEKCPSVTSIPLSDPRSAGFWKGIETKRLDLLDEPSQTPPEVVKDNLTVYAAFEAALAPCLCGGKKRFLANLRCPHCAAAYTDFGGDLWKRLSEVYLCHVSGALYVTGDAAWR